MVRRCVWALFWLGSNFFSFFLFLFCSQSPEELNVGAAREKFQGADVSRKTQEFGDGLEYKMMGDSGSVLDSLGPSSAQPTRYERFLRLEQEAAALLKLHAEDMQRASEGKLSAAEEAPLAPVIARELKALHGQLVRAIQERDLLNSNNNSSKGGALQVGPSPLAAPSPLDVSEQLAAAAASSSASSAVVWEIYGSSNAASAAAAEEQAAAAALERRVSRLEGVVGVAATPQTPMQTRLQQLEEAVKALEAPEKLAALGNTLQTLAAQMAEADKRNAGGAGGGGVSAKDLVVRLERLEGIAGLLPQVVGRLRALRGLHEEAALFGSSLQRLEQGQQEIKGMLESGTAALKAVEQGLAENDVAVKNSIATLQQRLEKLK